MDCYFYNFLIRRFILGAWKTKQSVKVAFAQSAGGFDAVLGARGSQLQLVLNALFHMENSPGNLAWEQYEAIQSHPGVSEAYPFALGDNYLGYRLVGTTSSLFTKHEWKPGKKYQVKKPGRIFSDSAKEALVGAQVAAEIGLKLGDKFHPYHGLEYHPDTKHEDVYLVVGILEGTGTPADQVIWIPLKGVQMMEGHDPAAANFISGVLLNLKGSSGLVLDVKYNKQGDRRLWRGQSQPFFLPFLTVLHGWRDDRSTCTVNGFGWWFDHSGNTAFNHA